jgi:hypothetical protein
MANADACDIANCITSVKSNNTGVVTECKGKASKESCFITTDLNKQFYHSVGDKFNKDAIKDLFQGIATELTENYDNEIRTLFDIGKTVGSAVKFKFVNNDNHQYCDDMIGVFYLEKAGKVKADTKNIFHISLHSEMPNYTLDKRRSLSACGFYTKGEKNTDDEGPGAFHYKIENIFWSPSSKQLRENEQPWKRLNINRSTPSMFIHDTTDFELFSYEIFRNHYKISQIKDDALKSKIEDGNKLHKKIYNMFVERWNKYVSSSESLEHNAMKLLVKGHISASKSKSRSRSRSRSRSPSRGGRRTRSNRKHGRGHQSAVKTRKSRR